MNYPTYISPSNRCEMLYSDLYFAFLREKTIVQAFCFSRAFLMYNPYDHYFDKAKKSGYKARSAFKLEAIHDKFHIFDANTRTVIDV